MIGCANLSCRKWLHSECIVKNTLCEISATNIQSQSLIATTITPAASPMRTVNCEPMALSPSPTGSDAEATFSLIFPPRATTTPNIITKHHGQSDNAASIVQPTISTVYSNIEGHIENGEHGLRIAVTDFSRTKTGGGGGVSMASADNEGGISWKEKVYCLACRAAIL
jgi:hypothetical protein